jgi:predicted Rossmann-fold nucleotide-binding protein
MLNRAVEEHFMRPEHKSLWSVVNTADEVLQAIEDSSVLPNARGLAAI